MNTVGVQPPITEYLYRKATVAGIPLSGTFELTPLCNMACKMCYVRLTRQKQQTMGQLATAQQWLSLAAEAKAAGMLYLLITGGEPFTHPQIRQILQQLHMMGFLVSINSNGTLIDEQTVSWLKTCPPVRINISLYGACDETYARLCGDPKGFTKAVNAIKLLQKAGIPVKLNCSLTTYNAEDLPKMAKLAQQWSVPLQVAGYMFPPVRADETMTGQNDRFTPEDAAYYTAYADYLTLGKERFLEKGCDGLLPPDPEEGCAEAGEGVRCRAGRCSFWITWQGVMTPCGMFPAGNMPNVFQSGFEQAWQSVKAYTAAIRLPAKCAGCTVKDTCRACAAMVITESGCFDKAPQYRCDMMHAYPAQWMRVKEEIL